MIILLNIINFTADNIYTACDDSYIYLDEIQKLLMDRCENDIVQENIERSM